MKKTIALFVATFAFASVGTAESSEDISLDFLLARMKVHAASVLASRIANGELAYGPQDFVAEAQEDARLSLCLEIGSISREGTELLRNAQTQISNVKYRELERAYGAVMSLCGPNRRHYPSLADADAKLATRLAELNKHLGSMN